MEAPQTYSEYYFKWEDAGLQRPNPPDEVRDWQRPSTLAAQEDYMLSPTVGKVKMGLGWDSGVDVDASAALFDALGAPVDAVYFHKRESNCESVEHSGDDLTGEGSGDDEVIKVDISKIPLNVHHILFAVSVFTEGYGLSQLRNAYVRMLHGKKQHKDAVLCRFDLSDMTGRAMLMGVMTRKGAYWSFKALGFPATGHTINMILQNPANYDFLRQIPTFPPHLRKATVRVLRGNNLMACDLGGTSDPYYKIKFKGREQKSRHASRTLSPVWEEHPFDMGYITEAEAKALKIKVYDYDRLSSDDFMGCVWIPASAVYNCGPGMHMYTFRLGPRKTDAAAEQTTGTIEISFSVEDI